MTEALHSLPTAARPCAVGCHATGGNGSRDGGFADVVRQLGVVVGETPWEDLPNDARRTGGVTCVGCHGPGAIPEASARWAILRADVCATCHDAPPTYGHVTAWRSSRMARADADPMARSQAECARCHTTSGFLASLEGKPDNRRAPPDTGPIGIACAACHAPHDIRGRGPATTPQPRSYLAAGTLGRPLLRSVSAPAWAPEGVAERRPMTGDAADLRADDDPSAVCLACHGPAQRDATRAPAASAAALWAGKGGVDPETARPVPGQAVHGDDRGCLGCHDGGPPGLERGASHGFHASTSACTQCHSDGAFDPASVDAATHDEAKALLEGLGRQGAFGTASMPSEIHHRSALSLPDNPLGRAAYDVLLVLEDPAAASHNQPYARTLLEAARRTLDRRAAR
jgi:hypothetical protein